MTKRAQIIVKYNLQADLYKKLGRHNEFMSSEYNTKLMEHIWTLSVRDLRTALK